LIISPWNYPILLSFLPLAGAIAAGNCAIIKPSEYSGESSKIIEKIINNTFPTEYITTCLGDAQTAQALLQEKFNYIFFTGSHATGMAVAQAAAKHLTPITLELGGKNPCVVHKDADIETTARKIAWAKFINAGQTCVAPDYLLAHNSIKQSLLNALKKYIRQFFGENPKTSPDYCRIINEKHFQRLISLLAHGKIICGTEHDASSRYIAPTIIDDIFSMDSTIMQEEIFGPILPVIGFEDLRHSLSIIRARPKPLAAYLFTQDKEAQKYFISRVACGGICVNDCMLQSSTNHLPFGGVGESGMGRCHGKATFKTFSNTKSILTVPANSDMAFRYPPYKKFAYTILRLITR
jgi:aldehyde dehydrogenase (NAD+)